jgi:hypothetical protein
LLHAGPDDFVLKSHDRSGTVLFLGKAREAMRIAITAFDARMASDFSLLSSRTAEGLVVEEWQNSVGTHTLTRIHDGKQQVVVYGGSDRLIDALVQGCLTKKHGELFED